MEAGAPWHGRVLEVRRLGTVPYRDGVRLQEGLVGDRRRGRVRDLLLLLEHPHVVTLGGGGNPAHVLASDAELANRGIERVAAGRGGDVTYHGPGQLVGYPILDLKPDRTDLHEYLRSLERVLIGAVAELGVEATREPSLTGIWVDGEKLGAIGIRVSSGWITSHGFALNVSTDLTYFDVIVPCGIPDRQVTSLSALLGRPVPAGDVANAVVRAMAREFGYGDVEDPASGGSGGLNS